MFPDPTEAHARRGAPHTFNASKYVELVKALKEGVTRTISAPSFDHSLKGMHSIVRRLTSDPVEEDIPILPSHRIVVLEGNYVHLTVPPWDQASNLLDEKWFILVKKEIARGRVVRRGRRDPIYLSRRGWRGKWGLVYLRRGGESRRAG